MSTIFEDRYSVRNFKQDEVPRELLDKLLDAAIAAPSAGNRQPWHFYVVRDPNMREKLSECAYKQKFIASAPVVIVVCAEPLRSAERYAERGKNLYAIQDTAAAIENLLLCATMNGLGACWCGAFDEEAVSLLMGLPGGRRPVAVIPVGYPGGGGKKPKRRSLNEVVTFID